MFAVVKNVQSWESLSEGMGCPPSLLALIQYRYGSDEDRLKCVIEHFFKGGGNQPSWRAVIWNLYGAKEFQLAEQIRSYAKPLQGTVI